MPGSKDRTRVFLTCSDGDYIAQGEWPRFDNWSKIFFFILEFNFFNLLIHFLIWFDWRKLIHVLAKYFYDILCICKNVKWNHIDNLLHFIFSCYSHFTNYLIVCLKFLLKPEIKYFTTFTFNLVQEVYYTRYILLP